MASSEVPGQGEALFRAHLPLIQTMLDRLVRRSGLLAADAEDFIATVYERLIQNDYAVVRAFAARPDVKPYLAATLAHFLCDFRNALWGRWRPSAVARRLGPNAIRLEQIMVRDGAPTLEAVRMVMSVDPHLAERDIMAIARQLPRRPPARQVGLEVAEEYEEAVVPPPDLDQVGQGMGRALTAALRSLGAEDRLITKLRFCDGMSIADISRALGLEQKPLYRRMLLIESKLRRALAAEGIGPAEAQDAIANGFDSSADWGLS